MKRLGLVPLLAVAGFTLGREGMGGWVAHNNRTGWLAVAAACLKGNITTGIAVYSVLAADRCTDLQAAPSDSILQ